MPGISVRTSGSWKRVTALFVRVSGSWKRVTGAWVRTGGVWKRVYPAGGQQEWLTPGTYSFPVPAGVTSIHAAVVGGSGNALSAIRRSGTELLSNTSTAGASFGGGDGGLGAGWPTGGGCGAGGYSGNGGIGHNGSGAIYADGSAGAGGAGGGGCSASSSGGRQHGGGVYLHGEGASGAGGRRSPFTLPGHGSDLGEGAPRGAGRYGFNSSYPSEVGGSLRYTKTAIAVTPGETLTIVVAPIASSAGGEATTGGGVRIIWGEGRSYPNNAKDV
ncbi:hypothetical protein [Pulveribacter sp.]|uniref:hypothetical protein n=1 Tax=Pulveribacter sp. TaxID=2678893 RepID=UPI0028AC46C7|nr:hypothetical protein [Pulveribacter sp.]